jgi:1-acyl-sn-glycerol-3-phosphate acyltransferase
MRSSQLTHEAPSTGLLLYWIARLWILFSGWKVIGDVPPGRKFVLIAAPHTSNWDLPHMLAAAWIFRLRISWLGKRSLFRGPFGPIMRWLGGIPIDRSAHHGVVHQVAKRFEESEALMVAVPPAGTRGRSKAWRSGFYWIAKEAQVPILCGSLDYEKKESSLGLSFVPTRDLETDMDRLRTHYRDITGKYEINTTPVRLHDEDKTASG